MALSVFSEAELKKLGMDEAFAQSSKGDADEGEEDEDDEEDEPLEIDNEPGKGSMKAGEDSILVEDDEAGGAKKPDEVIVLSDSE